MDELAAAKARRRMRLAAMFTAMHGSPLGRSDENPFDFGPNAGGGEPVRMEVSWGQLKDLYRYFYRPEDMPEPWIDPYARVRPAPYPGSRNALGR